MRLRTELEKIHGPMLSKQGEADAAAHQASTSPVNNKPSPTWGQIDAGNYPKGHMRIHGLDISIENPEGSTRSSKPGVTPPWKSEIKNAHYGYIRGTVGKDKDQIDVFVKPQTESDHAGPLFVIDQKNPATGNFDEHKVMVGYRDMWDAQRAYRSNYSLDWQVGPTTETTEENFKDWLQAGAWVHKLPFSRSEIDKALAFFFAATPTLSKDVTTATGLSTPLAGLTHVSSVVRTRKKKKRLVVRTKWLQTINRRNR